MIDAGDRTIWCGNLAEQVTEELLYELFLQAGPLEKVRFGITKGQVKNFAFITYVHNVSASYAINLFRGTTLFSRTLVMQCRGRTAPLPPPIRCFGPDQCVDFSKQPTVVQQFANMTENLQKKEPSRIFDEPRKRESDNKLVMASLQGNWTHRHHPYRGKEQSHSRDNHRLQDQHLSRDRDNWRDRGPSKKYSYR